MSPFRGKKHDIRSNTNLEKCKGEKMTVILKRGAIAFFFGQVFVSTLAQAKLPYVTPAQLIEAVKRGDSLYKNVDCRYAVDEWYNRAIHEKRGIPLKRNLEIHWRREGVREYFDVTVNDGKLFFGKPYRSVTSWNGDGRKQWTPNENKGSIFKKRQTHAWPVPIDFGMTLATFKRDKKLGESLSDCEITNLKQEQWQGHECYFVQAVKPDGAKAEIWMDPTIAWRARRVRYWGPDGTIWHEASGEFKDCGNGVWYPVEGVFKLYGNDPNSGERVVSNERKLKVEQVKLNADLTDQDFDIEFPLGTRLYYDHDREVGYIAGTEPARLTGKPLPDMKEFAVGLDSNQTKDKMLLICFFSVNQRPSRHCITQLVKQAEQLKDKGIAVIAAQASKVDQGQLDEWVKKYNVPFSVGMVQGDEEKVRFAWGVKSLPWLILADSEHIVRAEGFALAELDEKIGAMAR